MTRAAHRLTSGAGIHTIAGGNWNAVWKAFFKDPRNINPGAIRQQLGQMIDDFGILGKLR
jgi:hypothetical protein